MILTLPIPIDSKGMKRNLGGFYKSLVKGKWSELLDRWDVLFNKKKDPFDSYEWLDSLHLYCRTRAYYFFLMAEKQKGVDKNISPDIAEMRSLIAYHAGGYTVGIHPSWQSGDEESVLKEEVEMLAKITGSPVKYSRQHYIRMLLPETYRRLINAGIEKDFSMGYGGSQWIPGFHRFIFLLVRSKCRKKNRIDAFPILFYGCHVILSKPAEPPVRFYRTDGLLQKNKTGKWTDGNHLA